MILKFKEYLLSEGVESVVSLGEVKKLLEPFGWKYTRGTGDSCKFSKGKYIVYFHLKHGNSLDNNRKMDVGSLDKIREYLIDEYYETGDATLIKKIPWKSWRLPDPFDRELKNIDPETGKKLSDVESQKNYEVVAQLFKNVCVIQNVDGEYNLCKSKEDKTPLLDRWYPIYKPSKGLGGKMCLGYDIEDFDGEEKFGTHLFAIKEDGTLGTSAEPKYYIVESVKKS